MKILSPTKRTKCQQCGSDAEYIVGDKRTCSLTLCLECMKGLYSGVGRLLTPSSPMSPFKPKKIKE